MKLSKKILSIILAAVLAVTVMIPAGASFAAGALTGKVVIIYTSNLRGDIEKLPKIASVKKYYESQGASVYLTDTGNFLQGSVYASADKGYSVITLMESANYDFVALGKYDFAFGNAQTGAKPHGTLKQYLTLSQLLNGGENDLLSKNPSRIYAVSSNSEGSNSYFTFTGQMERNKAYGKLKFFGYTSPDVQNNVLESSLEGITFSALDSVKESGYITICLSNAGSVDADLCISPAGDDFEIGAYIIEAGADETANITSVDVNLDDYQENADVKTALDTVKNKVDNAYPADSRAKSNVILNGSQKAVRSEETNLGDLWCDALLNYGNAAALEVPKDNVVSIWNGGNLRDYLYDGNINIEDIHKVLPYPNTVAVAYVKGSALLEALEAAGQYDAAFASVAGMKYTINTYYDFEGGEEYEGSTYKQPLSKRVTITEVNGKAFDENAVYAVVTSNMIFNGGDTYLAFKNKAEGYNSYNSSDKVVGGDKVVDVVWDYIKTNLGGLIGSDYAETQGRITIINESPENPDAPVAPVVPAVQKTSIAKAKISGVKTKVYTGKAVSQSVKVKLGKKTLSAKTDYKVSYKNNKKVGTATVIITGKGNYKGSVKKTFSIIPKGTTFKISKNKKKTFNVNLKKQPKEITGYQIQYSTNKKFKKKVKSVKTKKLDKTVKKLNIKKAHYVRVRTYKKIGKKNYYSTWSKVKTVKAKK